MTYYEPVSRNASDASVYLQELVLQSADVDEFLDEMAIFTAANLSIDGPEILCGITLVRNKRATTVACSGPQARAMDELQYSYGDGPCLTSIRELTPVYVPDLAAESRWPEYTSQVAAHGLGSILAVPLKFDDDARAAMNLYCREANGFGADAFEQAETFAAHASRALQLTLRIAALKEARHDLSAAMQSRTTIDIAVGVIMGQNRCTQETAMKIMKNASSTRNLKLREVAASIVESTSKGSVSTHFDD